MKKIFCAMLMCMCFSFLNAEVEVSVGKAYSRRLNGSVKKNSDNIRLLVVNEVPKITDFDYIYGLDYRFSDGNLVDPLLSPRVGIRYYPINKILPVFLEGNIGATFNLEKNSYNSIGEIGLGLGRNDVVGNWYLSADDVNRFSSGVRVGYKF